MKWFMSLRSPTENENGGPLGLAHVRAKPTIGGTATIVFYSSGVKLNLLAIEFASCLLEPGLPGGTSRSPAVQRLGLSEERV
jgi:hypothetical protein